jgi:transposase
VWGISLSQLNDDAVGRVPDDLYEAGTNRILTAVGVNAVKLFDLDTSHAHHDTTSRSVYGAYSPKEGDIPFQIAHGLAKDKRPDLKKLVHSLL